MVQSKIAIFIDVENLTQWIKDDGPEKLLTDLSSSGQIIVRRAYGKWTNPCLMPFQSILNRLGFELIHNYHPVSGKNSTDIQLTIDAMEYAMRLNDVSWFVLATGDSDFSPLFRRLREMGKDVIGVGPRSPLSESVKTSCSKYIYTDITQETIKKSALDDAIELVEKSLKTFDGPASFGALKNVMTNNDSAFDEKALGFKSFSDFLKAIDTIKIENGKDKTAWFATFAIENTETQSTESTEPDENQNNFSELLNNYQKILKNKNWHLSPKNYLTKVYRALSGLSPKTKNELTEAVLERIDDQQITSTDVKRVITILFKAKLISISSGNCIISEDKLWNLDQKKDYLKHIDAALLVRLIATCKEQHIKINTSAIKKLLYGEYSDQDLTLMIQKAERDRQEFDKQKNPFMLSK